MAAYCSRLAPGAWVLGGGWTMAAFPGGLPTATDLDRVTGGRPAFLPNRDHHSAWVNTAALEMAGVDAGTPDPPDGRIERDQAGQPTGALHDGAMRLAAGHVPRASPAELRAGLLAAQAHLHSLGITRFQDACVGAAAELGIPDVFDTYRQAAGDGVLTCHVVGALWWDRHRGLGQVDDLLTRREQAERRPVPGHHGQADAGRGVRDVHRRHVRPLPGRPRPLHRPRGPAVHRAGDAGRSGPAAGRGAVPAALPRHRRPRGPRRARRAGGPASRAARRPAGTTSRTCSSSPRRTCPGSGRWTR